MNVNISYRNLEPSPAIEERIKKKASHLKRYFHGEVDVKWICSVEGDRHISDVNAHAGHQIFHAHAEHENLYKSFDVALDKVERQVKRKNNQAKDKIHKVGKIA